MGKLAIMPNNTSKTTSINLQSNGKGAWRYYVIALVVLVIDQLTKIGFQRWLKTEFNSVEVISPVLNWTLAYNRGAAFSFLANQGGWQKWFFALLGILVSSFIIAYLRKIPKSARLLSVGLALVLGGAIGNVIDRMAYGHVIDFIHVHWANVWNYPVFNVADIGVCVGMAFIVIDMLFLEKKRTACNALFVYGTLAPNCSNHHIMTSIANGKWLPAYVFGELLPNGFGRALGYPALIPNEKGDKINGFIFKSDDLTHHWDRLDEFEGAGYHRNTITAYLDNGEQMQAYVYVLADKEVKDFKNCS